MCTPGGIAKWFGSGRVEPEEALMEYARGEVRLHSLRPSDRAFHPSPLPLLRDL